MNDYAHTETDKAIEALEKRLQAEYRQAYKETKGKLEKYLSDFARKDEAKRKLVEKGELSKTDYKKWRTNQMLTGQRWVKMVDVLARDMNRTNQIAADIISGQLSPTFALNANFAAYGIENGFQTDFGFTLYNEDTVNKLIEENPDLLPAPRADISEDMRWNKQKITSNITQAVLQGKSIPEIAKTMQTVVGMNKASATRNARTAMTGAQNAGRQQAYDRAKAMGIKVKKEWVATLDGRTRHSHGMADGQQVEIDGKFKVGASELRYPGDPQGAAEEVYNCRCTMVTVEPPEILRGEEPRRTYQEWYKSKEKAENGLKLGGKSGIMGMSAKEQNPPDFSKYLIKDDAVAVLRVKSVLKKELGLSDDDIDLSGIRNADVLNPFVIRLSKISKETGFKMPKIKSVDIIDGDTLCVAGYKPYENTLYISNRYFNSKSALNDTLSEWSANGFLPKQAKSIQYLAEHEAAHVYLKDDIINTQDAINIWRKRKLNNKNDADIYEYYADVIAIYRTNPNASQIKTAVEYLKEKGVKL